MALGLSPEGEREVAEEELFVIYSVYYTRVY